MARPIALCALASVLLVPLATRLHAQAVRPAGSDERCSGQVVSAVDVRVAQRTVFQRAGAVGHLVNQTFRRVQPPTKDAVIRGYLLLGTGDRCDEDRRAESERMLRGQPFVSDAAIRAVAAGADTVRLAVEVIDEYLLGAQVWGLTGLPYGAELTAGNIAGTAKGVSAVGEYGVGDRWGWGASYVDRQAFGHPWVLELHAARRPAADGLLVQLRAPYFTNFQRWSWLAGMELRRQLYEFRSPELGTRAVNYRRLRWSVGTSRRLGEWPGGLLVGTVAAGETTELLGAAQILPGGIEEIPDSAFETRYRPFSSARGGVTVAYRPARFFTVQGLEALSARHDYGRGVGAAVALLRGIAVGARGSEDVLAVASVVGTVGTPKAVFRFAWENEFREDLAGRQRGVQGTGGGRVDGLLRVTDWLLSQATVEAAGGRRTRLPLQVSLQGDDGLIGHRSATVGGGERVIARTEHRLTLPGIHRSFEWALAGTYQVGRLWAGDAVYGEDTGWLRGVGGALLVAIPPGSKQTLRIELGYPLGSPYASGPQLRLTYVDHTRVFVRNPAAIWLASESANALAAAGR